MDYSNWMWKEIPKVATQRERPKAVATFLNCAVNVRGLSLEIKRVEEMKMPKGHDWVRGELHRDQDNLAGMDYGKEMGNIFRGLSAFEKLESLRLQVTDYGVDIAALCQFLAKQKRIRKLSLSLFMLEGKNAWLDLFRMLSKMDGLEELRLDTLSTRVKGKEVVVTMYRERGANGQMVPIAPMAAIHLKGKLKIQENTKTTST